MSIGAMLPRRMIFWRCICARTFRPRSFCFGDYSPLERTRLDAFKSFAAKVRAPAEFGLHDSPVDAYLIKDKFRDDRKAYVAWTQSDSAVEWLAALCRAPQELETLNVRVFEDFAARVEQTKKIFGPTRAVASHGGQLGQMLKKGGAQIKPDITALLQSLSARGWLTPQRVTAAGLISDVESFQSGTNNAQISDMGGKLSAFVRRLRSALSERRAVQGSASSLHMGGRGTRCGNQRVCSTDR